MYIIFKIRDFFSNTEQWFFQAEFYRLARVDWTFPRLVHYTAGKSSGEKLAVIRLVIIRCMALEVEKLLTKTPSRD